MSPVRFHVSATCLCVAHALLSNLALASTSDVYQFRLFNVDDTEKTCVNGNLTARTFMNDSGSADVGGSLAPGTNDIRLTLDNTNGNYQTFPCFPGVERLLTLSRQPDSMSPDRRLIKVTENNPFGPGCR